MHPRSDLGAVLSHIMPDGSERPIAYASRTLTLTERNYSQINKEALGLVWGVTKFHIYLYGKTFTMVTDHQPLVSVFHPEKSIPVTTAARMQRYAFFLAGFTCKIKYRNTKRHGNADSLSRLPIKVKDSELNDEMDAVQLFYTSQVKVLPVTHQTMKYDTQHNVLSRIYKCVMNGCPEGAK